MAAILLGSTRGIMSTCLPGSWPWRIPAVPIDPVLLSSHPPHPVYHLQCQFLSVTEAMNACVPVVPCRETPFSLTSRGFQTQVHTGVFASQKGYHYAFSWLPLSVRPPGCPTCSQGLPHCGLGKSPILQMGKPRPREAVRLRLMPSPEGGGGSLWLISSGCQVTSSGGVGISVERGRGGILRSILS